MSSDGKARYNRKFENTKLNNPRLNRVEPGL